MWNVIGRGSSHRCPVGGESCRVAARGNGAAPLVGREHVAVLDRPTRQRDAVVDRLAVTT